MPSTATAKAATKPLTKRQQQHLDAIRRLSDLSTLRHPRKPHDANFQLFDDTRRIQQLGTPFTYHEVAQLQLLRYRMERREVTDFPGMTHWDGFLSIPNLGGGPPVIVPVVEE